MTEPTFVAVDLTRLKKSGVLMAANERFFWPLGLALTWDYNKETGEDSGLHVRTWQWEDGHIETIETEEDETTIERRAAFGDWLEVRIALLPADERKKAEELK